MGSEGVESSEGKVTEELLNGQTRLEMLLLDWSVDGRRLRAEGLRGGVWWRGQV